MLRAWQKAHLDVVRICLKQAEWTNARRFGDVRLAWRLRRRLHLDEIVQPLLPAGQYTCRPADIVAIHRLRAPGSEFAPAEHWYASTALEDLLGVADAEVTKDRLYRTLNGRGAAHEGIDDTCTANSRRCSTSTTTCCCTT